MFELKVQGVELLSYFKYQKLILVSKLHIYKGEMRHNLIFGVKGLSIAMIKDS